MGSEINTNRVCTVEVPVRFNEADPLGIVWHGHYIRYFEDGREAYGRLHGISYMDFFEQDIVVPVVHVECHFKRPLKFGDRVRVEAIFEPCDAAKMIFRYNLYNAENNTLVATGTTTQVFLEKASQNLILLNPPFFEDWKKKKGF